MIETFKVNGIEIKERSTIDIDMSCLYGKTFYSKMFIADVFRIPMTADEVEEIKQKYAMKGIDIYLIEMPKAAVTHLRTSCDLPSAQDWGGYTHD
jgi:hypothetical protein